MIALAGPLLLVALVCARVDARSTTSPHAHVFLAQELVLVAGAALVAGGAVIAKLRVRRDAITLAVASLAALEIASLAGARDPWLALRSASVWLSGLALFVVARSLDRQRRDAAIAALLVPLTVVAGSVVLEALGHVHLSARHHAPGGLLGERNVAGELLVAGAPAIAYTCLADGRAWRRRVAHGVLALAACALVLTRTRSAWLAALVVSGLLVVVTTMRAVRAARAGHGDVAMRGRFARLVGAGVLGVAIALLLPTTLRWRSAHPYRDSLMHLVDRSTPSASGRLVQYATTWRMATANPALGVGPGNWAAQYVSYAERGDRTIRGGLSPVNRLPNSDLLGFAAERGLIALAVLGYLGLLVARRGGPSGSLRTLRQATLLAVAIMAALDAVLQTPAALLLVAWVLGTCSASNVRERAASAPSANIEPRWSRLALASFALVFAAASVPAATRIASLKLASRARGSDDLDRAARLDPGDVGLRLSAAESWIADGRCDRARSHLDAVTRFSPASPALGELTERCATLSSR